jgi:SNF2 family DNA or RNA helicase
MEPGAFPSRERYVSRYIDVAESEYGQGTALGLKPHRSSEFRRVVHGQWRRLAKEDVLSELPPKIYTTRVVDMPAAARAAYEGMREDMLAVLPDGGELNAMSTLAQLTRLLQLASASADVSVEHIIEQVSAERAVALRERGEPVAHDPTTDTYIWEHDSIHVQLREPSWKIDELIEVMRERPGRRGFCFAPSAQLVRLAGERATREGYRVGYVVGGQSARERTAFVDAFQRGELDLICLTTSAGGVGLTLTAASYAVGLLRPWSFVESSQVEDRAHRIGSEVHDFIEIIDIVAAGTIDEEVRDILKGKASSLAELQDDARIKDQALGGATAQEELDQAVKTILRDPNQVRALLQKKGK